MQKIRIYRKTGGLAQTFRPFFMNAEQMAAMEDKYPEGYFYWLR